LLLPSHTFTFTHPSNFVLYITAIVLQSVIDMVETDNKVRGVGELEKIYNELKGVKSNNTVDIFKHSNGMKNDTDIGCCSFFEFKPAFGCAFKCQYPCYLAPFWNKPVWNTVKDEKKILKGLQRTLFMINERKVLFNMGEQADALLLLRLGRSNLFHKIIDMFQNRSINITGHKLLLLTKDFDDMMWLRPSYENVVMSVSLNARDIVSKVELGATSLSARLLNLLRAKSKGMEYRVRIDPMFYGYQDDYVSIVEEIAELDLEPAVFTLGSLRLKDWGYRKAKSEGKPWIKDMTEQTQWGRRYPEHKRVEMYNTVIDAIQENFPDSDIAICKETYSVWKQTKLDPTRVRCNCNYGYVDMTRD